jgi:hypothetical protein
MASREELADEARRARKVRQIVDIATSLIMQSRMTRDEAEALAAFVRTRVLLLFPGREDTYELIYTPRFRRLIDEFAVDPPVRQGVVLRFPSCRG